MVFVAVRLIRLLLRRGRGPVVAAGTPAASGPLALLTHEVRYDLLASMRNPRARFFSFVFPIVLLVVLSGIFGNGRVNVEGVRVHLSVFYVAGILTMAIVNNAYGGLVILMSHLRETGVLKRRRSTPVPPAILIAGQALTTVVTVGVSCAALLIVARLFYGVGFSAPAIGAIAVAGIIGTLAFACVGYAVSALIGNPDAAQPVVQMTMLPLWFISGVFVPVSELGQGFRVVADVFPVKALADCLHLASVHASFAGSLRVSDLLVMAAWAIGGLVIASWRFSWLPSAVSA